MTAAKIRRSTTAPAAPPIIACRRWAPSSLRAAMAITTALSPERIRLVTSTKKSPTKNSPFKNSGKSNLVLLRHERQFYILTPPRLVRGPADPLGLRSGMALQGDLIDRHGDEPGVQGSRSEQVIRLYRGFAKEETQKY